MIILIHLKLQPVPYATGRNFIIESIAVISYKILKSLAHDSFFKISNNFFFARIYCDLVVDCATCKISAISSWSYPSSRYRFNTVLYPAGIFMIADLTDSTRRLSAVSSSVVSSRCSVPGTFSISTQVIFFFFNWLMHLLMQIVLSHPPKLVRYWNESRLRNASRKLSCR